MEALNYIQQFHGVTPPITGKELIAALGKNHQQIKNIAEIIQPIIPDIILSNENDSHNTLQTLIYDDLNVAQQAQKTFHFPSFYQGEVNTGEPTPFPQTNTDLAGKSTSTSLGTITFVLFRLVIAIKEAG